MSSRGGWPGTGSRRRPTGLKRFEAGLGDVLFFDHRQRRAPLSAGRPSAEPITVHHFAKRTQIKKLRFVFAMGCEMSGCEFCETNPNERKRGLRIADADSRRVLAQQQSYMEGSPTVGRDRRARRVVPAGPAVRPYRTKRTQMKIIKSCDSNGLRN